MRCGAWQRQDAEASSAASGGSPQGAARGQEGLQAVSLYDLPRPDSTWSPAAEQLGRSEAEALGMPSIAWPRTRSGGQERQLGEADSDYLSDSASSTSSYQEQRTARVPVEAHKSRYRGVSYDKKKRKWRVQIKVGFCFMLECALHSCRVFSAL